MTNDDFIGGTPERIFTGSFNGKWSAEDNERRHGILFKGVRHSDGGLELALATRLGRNIKSADWIEDIAELESVGLIAITRKRWDGVKTQSMVELKDEERTVTLTGRGVHFSTMTFKQAMTIAEERVTSIG